MNQRLSSITGGRPRRGGQRRLRDRQREEASRAILDAAEQVFGEEGLSARLDRVAARAGVAVGTLYNHFEDRGSLVAALSRRRREALVARIDAALETTERSPFEEQLRAFVAAISAHAREHGRFLAALVQSGEGPARQLPRGSVIDLLVARADVLVERGVAAGALRGEGAERFGLALVALARAFLLRQVLGGDAPADVEPAVVDLFLRGCAR